jgi:hypothetical protein
MEMIKKEMEVPKEINEVAEALENITKACLTATEDGFQAGTDLPAILLSAVAELPRALDGMAKLGEEFTANKAKFFGALMLSAINIAEAVEIRFAKKPE